MAEPSKRDDLEWEDKLAGISMAGVRPLTIATVAVPGTSESTYTVQNINTKRVVFVHDASGNKEIRFDFDGTASSTSFPIISGVYFVVEAKKDEVLHFFNTTGASIDLHIMEIR